MDSNEINLLAKSLGIDSFLGVFAADELIPLKDYHHGVCICNTDPSSQHGKHWIGLCLTKTKVIYFDSLNSKFHESHYIKNFLRKSNKDLLYNTIQIQSYDSDKCGIHALVFCHILAKKSSKATFTNFLASFASHKLPVREQLSLNYFLLIS